MGPRTSERIGSKVVVVLEDFLSLKIDDGDTYGCARVHPTPSRARTTDLILAGGRRHGCD
jgi:hypothetical protein